MKRGTISGAAALLVLLLVLATAGLLAGCGQTGTAVPTAPSATAPATSSTPSTTVTAPPSTVAEPPTVAPTDTSPSPAAIEYAHSLGGVSQQGKTLYFVIGASVGTEKEAQTLLDEAIPKFGDMQSYFIVQKSDNFQGMRPGYWVVMETYRDSPSEENLQFGRRAFPDAYVVKATVLTSDPIPVYEDRLGL